MAEIEIEGGGVRIRVAGMPEQTDQPGLWTEWLLSLAGNWKDAVAIVSANKIAELKVKAERPPAPRFEGSAVGFVIEQSSEWRNDQLPGGVPA